MEYSRGVLPAPVARLMEPIRTGTVAPGPPAGVSFLIVSNPAEIVDQAVFGLRSQSIMVGL